MRAIICLLVRIILPRGGKRVRSPIYASIFQQEFQKRTNRAHAGNWPSDLTAGEAIAYDTASSLVSGGVLPDLSYKRAVAAFGEQGAAEFIYLVGLYCMVPVTLNGFDVPVPEE